MAGGRVVIAMELMVTGPESSILNAAAPLRREGFVEAKENEYVLYGASTAVGMMHKERFPLLTSAVLGLGRMALCENNAEPSTVLLGDDADALSSPLVGVAKSLTT